MGTTLTGTTPQDTYDSLIKVTDNGPLSGSLKKLTDGLGNDSSLSLSTTAASFSGTLAVSGASTFSSAITMALGGTPRLTLQDTDAGAGNVGILFKESTNDKWTLASNSGNFQFFNEATASNALFISSTNNVGIGTSSPATTLSVAKSSSSGSGSAFPRLSVLNTLATQGDGSSTFNFSDVQVSAGDGSVNMFLATTYAAGTWAPSGQINVSTNHPLIVKTNNTEVARFLAGGGLTFNGDTAAANALDDYEEGTWTPVANNLTLNYTTTIANGSYTKIGNVVTVYWEIAWTSANVGGSSSTYISNLPFTSKVGSYATAPIWIESTAAVDQFIVYKDGNSTNLYVAQRVSGSSTTNAAASIWGATNRFFGSITYFV